MDISGLNLNNTMDEEMQRMSRVGCIVGVHGNACVDSEFRGQSIIIVRCMIYDRVKVSQCAGMNQER